MNSSTPRRTAMSPYKSPSRSAARRVLGDLTPRAVNTPSKQINSTATWVQSPLKQVHTVSPASSVDKENTTRAVAALAGRKRSIHEVDCVEQVAFSRKLNLGRGTGTVAEDACFAVPTVAAEKQHDTQERPPSRGSTTEPDTPSQSQQERENLQPATMGEPVPNSQESNHSFSEFVQWGSQSQEPAPRTQQQQPPAPTSVPTPPKKVTRIDLLRLRLGFATYKVRTNQVSESFTSILSSFEKCAATPSTVKPSPKSAPPTTTQTPTPSITVSAPSISSTPRAGIHIKARLDPGVPIPKLSAAPRLLPTACSSRMVGSPQRFDSSSSNMPSSPPVSDLPKCVSPEQVMSPVRSRSQFPVPKSGFQTPAAKRTRNADAEDGDGGEDEVDTENMTVQERVARMSGTREELTSSVVKGHAALGLLDLRCGGR